ncbi:alpha/beta fold hydrolase [Humidisolicoccus flavus]|uniref:alpha/beta fold hydrolase n=1 Tax=Humidisolicoccus flavus TaxID=3111414 RepID=UPI00324F58A5
MNVKSVNDVEIAVTELGDPDGFPVLLVHGFASNAQRNWVDAGWGSAFTEAGLRGVALDLRGHGHSSKPKSGYPVSAFFDDVTAVLDAYQLHGCGYLGYSMGARLGWRYAGQHPEAFARCVFGGLPSTDPFEGLDAELARAILSGADTEHASVAARIVRMARAFPENDPDALLALAVEVAQTPFRPAAAVPAMPVLLATGDRDDIAPDSEALLPFLESGSFLPIPGRNHINAVTSRLFKSAASGFLATGTFPE